MRKFCLYFVLLLVSLANARPVEEQGPLDSADSLDGNQVPLEIQFPQENQSPESEDLGRSILNERYQSLLRDDSNLDFLDSENPVDGASLQSADTELDDREKRSNFEDSELDADIKRYSEILEETGKSVEKSKLADDDDGNEGFNFSSGRVKRSASLESLNDEPDSDATDDNDSENEEEEDDSLNEEPEEEIDEKEESDEENSEATDEEEEDEEEEGEEETDDAQIEETEDQDAEQDVEDSEEDADDDEKEEVDDAVADIKEFLNELKSLDVFMKEVNEQNVELSEQRDQLGSLLVSDYSPKETSRSRRQTLRHVVHDNPVDYLKSLPQYKDVSRKVLTNAIETLMQPSDEERVEKQPAERQAVKVQKAERAPASRQACALQPPPEVEKKPQTKEEQELDKVIELRKTEEALVSKEQDEVIKAEHLAHTMQEDLHDVMREIRALKVEINAERKDAEKVSIETKEAQKDLEMHDERKYNARRKVDELYMKLTDLESDTCDSRSKRKALKNIVDVQHYMLARRRRMLKDTVEKQEKGRQEVRTTGNVAVHEPSIVRQHEEAENHKADVMAQIISTGQHMSSADGQAVARQAKPCETSAPSQSKKADEEYNGILQQIIIGEAQVKVEEVQVAKAEEEAISLHRRLSNVLSKLAALSIEMKNLQTQAKVSGKRAKDAQASLAYHDQVMFNSRKKVNAARNLESDLLRTITDQRMNLKSLCSTQCPKG